MKGLLVTTSAADLVIYNPSPETVKKIAKEFTRLVILAGYDGNYGKIFSGWIRWRRFGRSSQTDTYVQIQAGDGDKELNFGFVSHTLAAGYKQEDVTNILAQSANLTVGYDGVEPQNEAPRGRALFGMVRDRMREHAATNSATWNVNDSAIQMVPVLSYMPGDAIDLTPKTGLIGIPSLTFQGVEAKMLLNPAVKISGIVNIDERRLQDVALSPSLNYGGADLLKRPEIDSSGSYRVLFLQHTGDTRGQEWYTDVICAAVDKTANMSTAAIGMGVTASED